MCAPIMPHFLFEKHFSITIFTSSIYFSFRSLDVFNFGAPYIRFITFEDMDQIIDLIHFYIYGDICKLLKNYCWIVSVTLVVPFGFCHKILEGGDLDGVGYRLNSFILANRFKNPIKVELFTIYVYLSCISSWNLFIWYYFLNFASTFPFAIHRSIAPT